MLTTTLCSSSQRFWATSPSCVRMLACNFMWPTPMGSRLCSSQSDPSSPPIAPPPASAAAARPAAALPVNFGDISIAQFRIKSGIAATPSSYSRRMSELVDMEVVYKKEYLLPTGSFKERGALNVLQGLSPEQAKRGVVAASAGNHALALAYHGARRMGIPVTVVMPTAAPITKVQNCRDLGANVLTHGEHIMDARKQAAIIQEEQGLTYVNGFDDPGIIAGAGTMGIEMMTQDADIDAVVVPIGGGGLIAGVSLAVKSLRPGVQVIGVEPVNCASYTAALAAGAPVVCESEATLADGLYVPEVGANAFAIARENVDRVVQVKEKYIALAMLRLLEMEKAVVEGGGATGLAAALQGLLPELKGKRVMFPLCGGNVDTSVLGRVMERGLAADGRLFWVTAVTSDRPGGLAALTRAVAEAGGSIKDLYHERAWLETSISQVQVKLVVEVASREHGHNLLQSLSERGFVEQHNLLQQQASLDLQTGMAGAGGSNALGTPEPRP